MKSWVKVLLTACVIIGILVAVKSCVDKKNADLTVAYIGDGFVNREMFESGIEPCEAAVCDIDGDGEINIELMEISFNEQLTQSDRQNSMQKLANAIGMGAARVYFLEEKYVINNSGNDVFADLVQFGEGMKNPDGKTVAISVKGNKKVKSLGIDNGENMYIAVRAVSEMDIATDRNIDKKHESAMRLAEYILS